MSSQPNETTKNAEASNSATSNSAPSTASRMSAPVLQGAAAWSQLLTEEDLRCERTGFQAGVISIDHGPTGTDERTATVLAVLDRHLQFTHRVGVLNENELSILMIPVATVGATEQLARAIDKALRSAGIRAAIGFALRRQDGAGLHGAAARADACAAVAHSRQLRLTA